MFMLSTARLILRDLQETDLPVICALSREPAVTRYQTWLRFATEDEARGWLQKAMRHNERQPRRAYNLAIVEGQRLIGWLGFGRTDDPSRNNFEFGYALLPWAWGHGSMTEALAAALAFMFGVLGAATVFGECETTNEASQRVMEKVGMQLVETRRDDGPELGEAKEIYRFAARRAGGAG